MLESKRLKFIHFSPDLKKDFLEYLSKDDVFTFFEFSSQSTNQLNKYFEDLISKTSEDDFFFFFIYLRKTNQCIGSFTFSIDLMRDNCEIGYLINSNFWGKGYFKESLLIAEEYMKKHLKIHRVFAITAESNKPSIHGLLNSDYKLEGILEDYYKHQITKKRFNAVLLAKILS